MTVEPLWVTLYEVYMILFLTQVIIYITKFLSDFCYMSEVINTVERYLEGYN